MPVNQPEYDVAVETSWDGVDQSEFESFEQFANVHVWWNTENPETSEDVELPVAHMEDGQLKLVYEALNSAHDLASNAIDDEDDVKQVRNLLQNLREEEFPDREPLDADEESREVDTMNNDTETLTMQERLEMARNNQDKIKRVKIDGKDVDIVKDADGKTTLNVPIQALSKDRDGDFIDEKGQEEIIRQLKSGTVGMFPNHGVGDGDAMYDFRDLFGKFVDGDNQNGTTVGTSVMRYGVEERNAEELHPHAKQLVNLLEQDMPVGFSVGFIPRETDSMEDGEGMKISDLDLMEVSAVGIPSNPDAVPAAMSVNEAAKQSAGIMAKQAVEAGFDKKQVSKAVEQAFDKINDTMSEKDEQSEQDTNTQQENTDSKSEEKTDKQLSEETASEILSAANEATQSMLQDLEEQLNNMVDGSEDTEENQPEDDDNEDEAEDEDKDEQENVEENSASDHSEDEKSSSSESADKQPENKEPGLSEDEKTVNDEESDGRKMNTFDDESEKKETEEKSDENDDPARVIQSTDYWG